MDKHQWLETIFREKKEKEDSVRAETQLELYRRATFEALIDQFWQSVIEEVSALVESYNTKASHKDRLYQHMLGKEKYLIEKQSHPPARLVISLNRAAERIQNQYHFVRIPPKTFQVRLSGTDLHLETPSERSIPSDEIAHEMLREFVEEIVSK